MDTDKQILEDAYALLAKNQSALSDVEYDAQPAEEKLKREQEFRDSLEGLTPAELRAKKTELIQRKNRLDKNVKYMDGLVGSLRKLSKGKLQDRFLYALRTASPELYRKAYPRRYRDIDTHYSPNPPGDTTNTRGDGVLEKRGTFQTLLDLVCLCVNHPFPGNARSSSRGPCLNSACTRMAASWLVHTLVRIEPWHSSECTHTDRNPCASVTKHPTAAPL